MGDMPVTKCTQGKVHNTSNIADRNLKSVAFVRKCINGSKIYFFRQNLVALSSRKCTTAHKRGRCARTHVSRVSLSCPIHCPMHGLPGTRRTGQNTSWGPMRPRGRIMSLSRQIEDDFAQHSLGFILSVSRLG